MMYLVWYLVLDEDAFFIWKEEGSTGDDVLGSQRVSGYLPSERFSYFIMGKTSICFINSKILVSPNIELKLL
jgi:hypothetical protein